MRITSNPGPTAALDPDVGLDNLGTSLDDSLVQIVTGLSFGADGVIRSTADGTPGTYTFTVTATRGSIVIKRPVKITVS